jgi:hypothetical protein
MASLGDEIDNCGLFLEQRRRHIFCSGKLSTQQPDHARILPAKVQLLNFLDSQANSAHQSINLEQVLDAAVQYVFPDGFSQIDNGVQGSETVFTGDRSFVNIQHADLFPVGGFKTLHWRLT